MIRNEFNKNPIFNSLVILNLVLVVALFFLEGKDFLQKATLIVLICTLIIIIWYAFETRRMANIQEKDYLERKKPLLSVNLVSDKDVIFKSVFQLVNHKPLFTTVRVYATFKYGAKDIYISDHYNGKRQWIIQPSSQISAPLPIAESIKKTFDDEVIPNILERNKNVPLNVKITLDYESEMGEGRKNRPIKYYYEFSKQTWVLNVDAN